MKDKPQHTLIVRPTATMSVPVLQDLSTYTVSVHDSPHSQSPLVVVPVPEDKRQSLQTCSILVHPVSVR